MRKLVVIVALVAVLAVGAYFVFGRTERAGPAVGSNGVAPGGADAPLTYVPADTPWLLANTETMPRATVEAWLAQSEPALAMYRTQYDLMLTQMQADADSATALKWMQAIEAEFRGKTLLQSTEMLGFDLQSYNAFYGIGLVPVMRVTLADPDKLRAFVARVEGAAGEKIPSGAFEGVDYWQFTDAKAPLRLIVALQGKHLVATIAPAADDAALRTLLGIEKPAQSMADAKPLHELNTRYGYRPWASGYVDNARVVALLTGPSTPVDTAFLTALEIEKPAVDATCQAEYAALAQAVPRLVLGYTELEPKRQAMTMVAELRPDIAKDLMTLRAPMPGLAAGDDSLFNFGFSLKLAQLPPLVTRWASAVKSAPWQCATLAPLNQSFADAGLQINNPGVFMAGPVFEGFHAIVTRFSMPATPEAQPDFAGKLLIGSPSPAALVNLAASTVPTLAQLQLEPDGEVKPVPAMPGLPPGITAHVAMTDKLLGIAVGAGEETTLKQAMTSDAARQPLFLMGYTGAAFVQFMEQAQTAALAVEQDEAKRKESEQILASMRQMYELIDRAEVRLEFEEAGVVLHSDVTMN